MVEATRSAILSKIRASLGTGANDDERRAAVRRRLDEAPKGIVPMRGQLPTGERVALFREKAEAVNATVETVSSHADLPASVSRYLRERNLPAAIRIGADERLHRGDWSGGLTVSHGPSDGNDLTGLSHAFGGVAETGTLMLTAGPENPTTLNFLPEYHLVAIGAADIAGDMETAWAKLRERYGKAVMSRVVNFVTGPSRSADIEQTLLLGAHGPRALHIIIVDGEGPS
jgi:L-lactate dehydrogenase complex protein LldG